MTPIWNWTLNSQILLYIHLQNTYLRGQTFGPFAQWLAISEIHVQGRENWKCTEWPQTELEHLTVKITLYTLHPYPRGPNFALFCSTVSRFWDTTCTQSAKIGNAPNAPQTEREHLAVKNTLYTLNTYPWGKKKLFDSKTTITFDLQWPSKGQS